MSTKMTSFLATSLLTTMAAAESVKNGVGISIYQGEDNLLQLMSYDDGKTLDTVELKHEGATILKIDMKKKEILAVGDDVGLVNKVFWWRLLSVGMSGGSRVLGMGREVGSLLPPLFSKDPNGCVHATHGNLRPYCPEDKSPTKYQFIPYGGDPGIVYPDAGLYQGVICMCGATKCACPGDKAEKGE